MSLIASKKIQQTVLASVLICGLPVAQAWVTPVNMDIDHEGNGGDFHRLTKTVGVETVNIDRCDTLIGGYGDEPAPSQCHRHNLVWQLGSKNESDVAVPLAQWNPELGDDSDWRLPTIKELARLVDYSGITAAGGALTGQPLILNMFPTEAAGFTPTDSWLISSTHRDIDGDDTNGQAQIFGINMGNGEIAAFDTLIADTAASVVVGETVDFTGSADSSYEVNDVYSQSVTFEGDDKVVVAEIVTSSVLNLDGDTYTISGQVHTSRYPLTLKKCVSLDGNAECAPPAVADPPEVVDVYALLVHTTTVKFLFP